MRTCICIAVNHSQNLGMQPYEMQVMHWTWGENSCDPIRFYQRRI